MRLLLGYILSKIHLLVDERNVSVCIVKGTSWEKHSDFPHLRDVKSGK